MESTKIYKNPPLVEAVFEIFFESKKWNPTIPGLFYSKVQNQYPIIISKGNNLGFEFEGSAMMIGNGVFELTQFRNKNEGDKILQLSRNFLSVNQLPPYDGWEKYRERIKFAVGALYDSIEIEKIVKIGLRVINKIDILEHSMTQFEKYFNIKPFIPDGIIRPISSIQMELEFPIKEKNDFLSISVSTKKKEPNYNAPVLFQIYRAQISDIPTVDYYFDWVETAHNSVKEVFDRCITNDCKLKFDVTYK
jgi:uncharacterized protein (TIGR04255 family)